ncbi:hypothetical protein [Litoreibacter janthinus]|uniref:Uncharacterized protein n=1 Tax=Litoreibacter janthinus TaxID=670154 RepID=A0A1I6HXM7_9RHOB|nr:hypothetical protein [Litoreibacter janthinus]SFR59168.1 hypothetical protein SAMN04488002_3557 [Litoreibacter janthinus]
MSVLAAVLKRIQLFVFAFMLAGSSMMFAGIASGKLERGDLYTGLAGQFAAVIAANPALLGWIAGGDRFVMSGQQAGVGSYSAPLGPVPRISTPQPPRTSLQALRQRQQQFVVIDELATDG